MLYVLESLYIQILDLVTVMGLFGVGVTSGKNGRSPYLPT